MFNTVESSDEEFEWGKLEGASTGDGDSKKSGFKFLNGQTESEVQGTFKSQSEQKSFSIYLEHTGYNVDQEISAGDKNKDKTIVTQEQYYNRHFIFDNVTSFGITGLRWNVPRCDYFDILIPSLPDEAFVKNMFNEPIISRQTGGLYYQDPDSNPPIPSIFKGTSDYQDYIQSITSGKTYKLQFTLSKNSQTISYTLPTEYSKIDTLSNFINYLKTEHDPNLSVSSSSEDSNIIKFETTGSDVGHEASTIHLSPFNDDQATNTITNQLDIIRKIFGYADSSNATIDDINPDLFQQGMDGHSQINFQESFNVSAQFSSPISLDFNSIKIYAKFYGIPNNHTSHPNQLDLSSINTKLIEVYPTNELTMNNLSKKFNINISEAHDSYNIQQHIFFQVSVTTK